MRISLNAQSDLRLINPVLGTVRPAKIPPFMGITPENVPLFKMAYLAMKNEEIYDGFEKMVGI